MTIDARLHRPSDALSTLSTVQLIEPGDVNWMTAGHGIVHSERALDEDRGHERPTHGLQLWVALPPALERCEPSFQHVGGSGIPEHEPAEGVRVRVLVGTAWGRTGGVEAASPTLYLDLALEGGASFELPALAKEMAAYSVEHPWTLNGEAIASLEMVVLPEGAAAQVAAGAAGARIVVAGGDPLERPVRMWWNFVATQRELIAQAAHRWEAGEFPVIPGEGDLVAGPAWRD